MHATSDEVHNDTTDAKPAAAVGNSKLDPLHELHDVSDVESKARLILETNSFVSSEQILDLFDKLPKEEPNRGADGGGASFTTGAYSRVKSGLRANCGRFPCLTRLLGRFVQQVDAGHVFTTIVIMDSVMTVPHRDVMNAPYPNMVVPLSKFEGGSIWVESGDGDVRRQFDGRMHTGIELPVATSAVKFDARRSKHLTCSWTGRRVVLIAFTTAGINSLVDADLRALRDMEFHVPRANTPTDPIKPTVVIEMSCLASRGVTSKQQHEEPERIPAPEHVPVKPSLASSAVGLVLELCSGDAQLSRCFHEVGYDVFPVDHAQNRFHPLAKVCNLDLSEASTWDYLGSLLCDVPIAYIHARPPCGTCRKTKPPNHSSADPWPVRDGRHPWGVPGLDSESAERVERSNRIYRGLAAFLHAANQRGILWGLESPTSGGVWELPCFAELFNDAHLVHFDTCSFGTNRKLRRTLLTSCQELKNLGLLCQGDHSHKPHGLLPQPGGIRVGVSERYSSPRPFCKQLVEHVSTALGVDVFSNTIASASAPTAAASAASAVRQSRGRRNPALVPEFKTVLRVVVQQLPSVDSKRKILQACGEAPAGSKLLSSVHVSSESGVRGDARSGDAGPFRITLGVYASEQEFTDAALGLDHPFDALDALDDDCKRMLFECAVKGPSWMCQHRAATLSKWLAWANELQADEEKLHDSMEPGVRHVLEGKRILLLERIAKDLGWVDVNLFDEIKEGFRLVGDMPHTGVFARELRPGGLSVEQFVSSFKYMRPALLGKVKSTKISEEHKELWQQTVDECSTGILEGPLSVDDVHERHGHAWVPVRRFGISQSSAGVRKLRAIDDFSENRLNVSFSYQDKIDLRALDVIISMTRAWVRIMSTEGSFSLKLSDGTLLEGRVHAAWRVRGEESAWHPVLTTLDLKAAYKQYAIHPTHRAFNLVALMTPEGDECKLFEGRALPFGATSSVIHFNRISRLLWRIGIALMLPWGNFYDDFPVMSPKIVADNTMCAMKTLMQLLGVKCSLDKLREFSVKASVLGIEIDVGGAANGWVHLRNKEGRADETVAAVKEALLAGSLSRRGFARVAGRVQFADAQVMGRSGKLALADLRAWSSSRSSGDLVIDARAAKLYNILVDRLVAGAPRAVPCLPSSHKYVIFTDGSSEGDAHWIGGVFFSTAFSKPKFFASKVHPRAVSEWSRDMKHIIGPVELYAVIAARLHWHQFISGQCIVYYVDNYPVLDALIKGTSTAVTFRDLLACYERKELHGYSWAWFSRVPSESNCADAPSRGEYQGLVDKGWTHDRCVCPIFGDLLEDL